jgi:hypothetical protein
MRNTLHSSCIARSVWDKYAEAQHGSFALYAVSTDNWRVIASANGVQSIGGAHGGCVARRKGMPRYEACIGACVVEPVPWIMS